MRRLVPVLSILVVLTAAVAAGLVWSERRQSAVVSEVITRQAPELGPRTHLLLPSLNERTVVVPDRPHDGNEARSEDRLRRIQRRRSFTVSTNSRGLRGPEFADTAPGFRIVAYGDSVTFGWGVTEAESWPRRLSELLGVEVVNAGVPAMKPRPLGRWIQQTVGAWDADLVVFAARPHHAVPSAWQDYENALMAAQAAARPAPLVLVLPPISTFDPLGVQNQASELQRVRQIAQRLPGGPVPVLDLTPAFRAALPDEGVVMEQTGGLQRMVRLPDRAVLAEGPPPAQGALASEIVAAFEADPSIAEPLFFDGGHPDAAGFAVFSSAVAAWLRSERLVPPPAGG
jgi:hypothetical protein